MTCTPLCTHPLSWKHTTTVTFLPDRTGANWSCPKWQRSWLDSNPMNVCVHSLYMWAKSKSVKSFRIYTANFFPFDSGGDEYIDWVARQGFCFNWTLKSLRVTGATKHTWPFQYTLGFTARCFKAVCHWEKSIQRVFGGQPQIAGAKWVTALVRSLSRCVVHVICILMTGKSRSQE